MSPLIPVIPAIGAVLSKLTVVTATMGSMIVKYAPIVLKTVATYLPTVCQILQVIGKNTNILKPDETTESLGAKAMSTDKKPEDFDSTTEYINYLQEKVSINKTALSSDETDITIRQTIGSTILMSALADKLKPENSLEDNLTKFLSPEFLKTVAELAVTPSVVLEILKVYSKTNLNTSEIQDYMSDNLDVKSASIHRQALVTALQNGTPGISRSDAEESLFRLK